MQVGTQAVKDGLDGVIFCRRGFKAFQKCIITVEMSDYTYNVHCQALLDGIPLPAYSAPGSGSSSTPSAAPAPVPVASPIVRGATAPTSGGK